MQRTLRYLGSLAVVLIFALFSWLLYHELKNYHYRDLRDSLQQIPLGHCLAAVLLTLASYTILVGYDLLALRFIGHKLPLAQVAQTSFISYSSSNNFGALLGGSTVRFRLYSALGLSAVEVVELVGMLGLTLTLGVLTLTSAVFLLDPLPVPVELHLPFADTRPLGGLLLAVLLGYWLLVAVRPRPIKFRGWELEVPSPGFTVLQMLVSCADLCVACSVLYVLLPPDVHVGFPKFLGIFLLGFVAGILTHVPAGLGVFELVLLSLVPAPKHELLAALVMFRAIYYLLPLLLATALFAVQEGLRRKELLRRVTGSVAAAAPVIVPTVLGSLAFVAGVVLLFGSVLPIPKTRLAWLVRLQPLAVVEASNFLGSVVGAVLLFVARGLQRRLDSAFWTTCGALALGIVFSLLKGADYEQAAALALVLAVLIPCRRQFYRRGPVLGESLSLGWVAAVVLALTSMVWLGLFAHKHTEYSDELWWRFTLQADAPRSLRAVVGAAGAVLLLSLFRVFRPSAPRPSAPSAVNLEKAAAIVAQSEATGANLALLGDKDFLFHPSEPAFVMYAVKRRSWVALGDPVGSTAAVNDLAWLFREMCDSYDGWPVFYQVGTEHLPLYLDLGLTLLKLGEEARVPLADFSLEGKGRKNLRHAHSRFASQGCTFEVLPPEQTGPLFGELKRVSDDWLTTKNVREKAFSLGYFDEPYLHHFPLAIVRREGRIVAFANIWRGANRAELSPDLMRYSSDAPPGVMDGLFVELMLWGKAQGYGWFNLGMAPMSGLEQHRLAPLWHRFGSLVYRHGEHVYNFQGLRDYKDKFQPIWTPKYLASPGGLALPRILTDVATLISRGATGLVAR